MAKVVTYIPGETIAAYQAAVGFVPPEGGQFLAYFAAFLLVFTPCWLLFATSEPGQRLAWYQAFVGLVAFLIWLLVVQSPFWDWVWKPTGPGTGAAALPGYARSIILIAATLTFPLVEKVLKRFGVPV
jgi:hypothetical protein